MQIDWWTFIAQIINLIILLFLLRKFLYIPVLKAVEKRQKLIADELNKAAVARRKADELSIECEKKLAQIDVQKQEILSKSRANAEKFAQELMIEAQEQYKDSVKTWKDKLLSQQKTYANTLRILIADYFARFADRALSQMADEHLNDLFVAKFIEQLQNIPIEKKQSMIAAFEDNNTITVQSSQQLSPANIQQLQQALSTNLQLSQDISLIQEINSELICGIALQAGEQLISWNLADYLHTFQQQMNEDMQQLLKGS